MTRIFLENADNTLTGIYVTNSEIMTEILKQDYSTPEKLQNMLKKDAISRQMFFKNAEESRNCKIQKSYLFSSNIWMLSENGSRYYPV